MARRPYDPPFSLRLSFKERARLQEMAEGQPLGGFLRASVLDLLTTRRGTSIRDRVALAQVLGLLGQSRLYSNLDQLAKLANIGSLPPDASAQVNSLSSAILNSVAR
jgi:hypothetical protein